MPDQTELLRAILEEQVKTNAYLEAASQAIAGLAGLAAALGLPTVPTDGSVYEVNEDGVPALPSSGGFFGGN